MRRGEVWWYEPPDAKARPVLLLTREEVIPFLHDVVAIPATTTRRGIPTEVELGPEEGMPRHCVLTADNLLSVRVGFLSRRITELGASHMSEVCEAVRIATGC